MDVVQSLLERLRPLVGSNSWDYCVLWKLGEDQRFIEWVGCCCGGAEKTQNGGGEELLIPVVSPSLIACGDLMYQHPTTNNCHLLSHLPSSMPLDSAGLHAQTLLSNQPRWINLPNCLDSSVSHETIGTRVLIPMSGGLIELFVAKHITEDPYIIEFVMTHCNVSWGEEEAAKNSTSFHEHPSVLSQEQDGSSSMVDGLPLDINGTIDHQSKPSNTSSNHFHPGVSPSTTSDNLNSPWDPSLDQIHISSSPMNFFSGFGQQFPPSSENGHNNDIILEGSTNSILSDKPMIAFDSPGEHGYNSDMVAIHQSLMGTTTPNFHPSIESSVKTKDPIKQETGRADSISDCSEDDIGDQKVVGRAGRGHKSKNLVAERNRRKKLNERLYALRALVPNISKMDKASILGDAIEFVKELQKQVKELQDELEEPPGNNGILLDPKHDESLNGSKMGIIDNGTRCSSNVKVSDPSKQSPDTVIGDDKAQQMEVQVEVTQLDGNEFFLKVFAEHKPGGFLRLMEAMNSLGLEVTNANVTTFRGLVLNVFKVEKRDNEMVQANHVRDSLLELTRNPIGGWSEPNQASENYQNLHHQHHHINSHLHSQHLKA